MYDAARLYEAANRAALDAIRYARSPDTIRLAAIRRQDARSLRSLASKRARQDAQDRPN